MQIDSVKMNMNVLGPRLVILLRPGLLLRMSHLLLWYPAGCPGGVARYIMGLDILDWE